MQIAMRRSEQPKYLRAIQYHHENKAVLMEQNTQGVVDYNDSLRKISNSLENALKTFGPSSRQYQTILEMLKECLRDIDNESRKQSKTQVVDADMLSLAMGFLDIGNL
ncbi:uncharacterized protein N7515_010190 [Penicillium bovifimosum]|uniref:Uncharacterized protein n=1 Tax=Penicillium bovifimosum TaxID=126998 RepID=A0A9W9KUU9_9EURO|nr:uncharacterized protein N7515_010190 [Penicillium bovifimosum]KAJ5120802.1 hypothetical protein N7515_010190 [Penicillium bovifimosum]